MVGVNSRPFQPKRSFFLFVSPPWQKKKKEKGTRENTKNIFFFSDGGRTMGDRFEAVAVRVRSSDVFCLVPPSGPLASAAMDQSPRMETPRAPGSL